MANLEVGPRFAKICRWVFLVPNIGTAVWLVYFISQVYNAIYVVAIIAVIETTILVSTL